MNELYTWYYNSPDCQQKLPDDVNSDGHNEVEAWSLESEGINESLLLENNNEHR